MARQIEAALGTKRALALVIAVALGLAARSIAIGFLTDDHGFRAALHARNGHAPAAYDLFRFVPGDLVGNARGMRSGRLPWWSAPDLKIHFVRPLTSLAFALDEHMFHDRPLGYHLVSLAWYAALLLVAASWFRRLLPAPAATCALAVFAWAAAHVEAYAWISARHIVIAATFAAAALAAVAARRSRAWAALLLALGLTASEAALAAVPIWAALEVAAWDRSWHARLSRVVPPVSLAMAYLMVYHWLGGGTRASGGYHDPAADPGAFLSVAMTRLPALLGSSALGIPAELALTVPGWKLACLGVASAGVVALAWHCTRPRGSGADHRQGGTMAWLALGGVVATLPGIAGFPGGRVLVIPDLAFAALLGLVLHRGLVASRSGRALALLLAVAHLGLAPVTTAHAMTRLIRRSQETRAIAAQIERDLSASGVAFIVAASDPMVYLYPRTILSDVAPHAVRCLSTLSAARSGHRLTRTGGHTFVLEPMERPLLDGSFDQLFRSSSRPFAVGDTAEQCGAKVRIAAVNRGLPTRLEVEMRSALDDEELALLVWQDRQLTRLRVPAIGGSIELPWSPGPTGVL
jgi:hypothetical protein